MSITGIGNPSAAYGLAAPADLSVSVGKTEKPDPAEAARIRAEAARTRDQQALAAIREKGIYAWAQEVKYEKLKDRIRQQVLEDQGLSEKDLQLLPRDERAAAELTIQEAIARLVKAELEKVVKGKAAADADGQTPQGPQIIDISV